MVELVFNIVFVILAVISIVGVSIEIDKISKLRKRFKQSIVLVPMYKTSKLPAVGIIIFAIILIVDIILFFSTSYYIACISIVVISIAMIVLFVEMQRMRCAVLDIGVVVPYRFIAWTHFYDYELSGDTIYFVGDENGNNTLSSATQSMRFEAENKEKLSFILSKHRITK